jgi:hypothetical protein
MKAARVLVLAAGLLGSGAAVSRADWLVTHDGERFEIQGSWQLKGNLAVFTLPDGTLSSIRADRIDTAASKQLTDQEREAAEAAAAPAPPKVAAPRKSVVVLTDKDFEKASPPADSAAAGDARTKPPAADAKASKASGPLQEVAKAVEITAWARVSAAETKIDGLEIKGTLRNASLRYLTEVTVSVSLFDETGTILGIFPATVANQVLPPGESSAFYVPAKGVYTFGTLTWETHGQAFRELGAPKPAGADAAGPKPASPPSEATQGTPAAPSTAPASPPPPAGGGA